MSNQTKREYHDNTQKCPCMDRCPDGCPCPEYTCPGSETTSMGSTSTKPISFTTTTTTTQAYRNTSILVLNTYQGHLSLITDSFGKVEYAGTDFDFEYGSNTEAYHSCSLTWRGDFFIFGGIDEKTQISKLSGCKLERISSLAFHHKQGACSNVNDEWIYLCFNTDDSADYKKCRRSNSPSGTYQSISDSNEDHRRAKIGSNQG